MQHFDRVIIEPSGIFDMDEFFDILHESPLDNWFTIGSIIGIIDPESTDRLTEQMEYLFASEAACCGKLAVSKYTAEVDTSKLTDHLNSALAEIKCDRRFAEKDVIAKDWSTLTAEDFRSFMTAGYRSSSYIKKYRAEEILSSVHYFMRIKLPDEKIIPVIKEIMQDEKCGRIFRIKGSLFTEKQGWLKINAMPENIETEPVSEGQSVLIVIGDAIDRESIDAHLTSFNTDPEYVSI